MVKKKKVKQIIDGHIQKVDLRKDNQGSTLMLVVIALLVVGIAVVAFQTSVASFATRTLTQHYEKQAYLSARSVADAVVQELGTLADGNLSSAEQQLLEDLYNQEITDESSSTPDVISLGNITFDDIEGLNTGDIEVFITRTGTGTYEVQAVADVNGTVDSVTAVLSANLSGSSGQVEVSGSWSGFYTDFGVGLASGAEYAMNDGTDSLVLGSASYTVGSTSAFSQSSYGEIYSDEDLIYESMTFQNGSIQTEGSITLGDNVTVTNANAYIKAAQDITISGTDVSVTSVTYSQELNITGDGAILQSGPYVAETITIDADNVVITGSLICENLYITGNNIRIEGTVTADNIYTNVTNQTFTGSLSAKNVVVVGGDSVDTIQTPVGFVAFDDTTYASDIAELSSFSVINRTKPSWAEKSVYQSTAITYDDSTVTTMDPGNYYYIDSQYAPSYTSGWANLTTKVEDGVEWDVLRVSYVSDVVYIVVQDGQNLEVLNGCSNVYFILEGNAKLKFSSEWGNSEVGSTTGPVRIYGESVSDSLYNEIEAATKAIADQAVAGIITYDEMQDMIADVIETNYWDEMSAVILDGTVNIYGSTVAPYIKVTGTSRLNEIEYEGDTDDLLSDDEASDGGSSSGSGGGISITFEVDAYK